jgi:anaerobic ribonucleoside-triphosphate reductase activating protein
MEVIGLFIHAIEHGSYSNGPGRRIVVWTQGCSIRCEGCWNPETHDAGGTFLTREKLLEYLLAGDFEGVTFSGGEPFDQGDAVLKIARSIRDLGFSCIAFSGFTLGVLENRYSRDALDSSFDALLTDPYKGSSNYNTVEDALTNKTVTFLNQRYGLVDFNSLPEVEVIVDNHGEIITTGLAAPYFRQT